MDFIVSKVVLSVCALMTVGILYGVYGGEMLRDTEEDLERIAVWFADEAVRPSVDGAESAATWEVPDLPDGDIVWFVVGGLTVEAHSGSAFAVVDLPEPVHTWSLTGDVLNSTEVDSLDGGSARIRACTGQHLSVTAVAVTLDGSESLMLFAESSP